MPCSNVLSFIQFPLVVLELCSRQVKGTDRQTDRQTDRCPNTFYNYQFITIFIPIMVLCASMITNYLPTTVTLKDKLHALESLLVIKVAFLPV